MSSFVTKENGFMPFSTKAHPFSTTIEEAQATAKILPHPDCRPTWWACFASSRDENLPFTSALEMQGLESHPSEEYVEEYEVKKSDGDGEKIIVCEEENCKGEKYPLLANVVIDSIADEVVDDFTLIYDVKERKINLRFAHYPTYEPLLLELKVEPATSLKSLRDIVEEALMTDEYCRMKMCTNWFTEVKTGDSRNRLALTTTDTDTVKSVGLDDESVIYLEGPLSGSIQGVDTAIAIVNSQGKKQAAQQNELLHLLVSEVKAMRESLQCRESLQMKRLEVERAESRKVMQQLSEEIRSLRNENFLVSEMKAMRESQTHLLKVIEDQQKQIKMVFQEQETKFTNQVESLITKVEEVKNTLLTNKLTAVEEDEEEEDEEDYEERYKEAQPIAKAMLARAEYAGQPLKAFWDVLCDEKKYNGPYLARAIVNDQRCGIERKTTDEEARTINIHNLCGATPLVLACHAKRVDVMQELILDGANFGAPTRNGYTALRVAVMNDNASAIELLLDQGASAGNAMNEAVSLGKAAAIGALIDKGESFGQPCYVGPMHNAAAAGHAAALEVMIKKGAYVDMPMSTKKTPLHYAAANGRLEAIELLVSKGANVELRDRDGQTPLMMLSRYALSQVEQSRAVALLTPKVRALARAVSGANSNMTTRQAEPAKVKTEPLSNYQFGHYQQPSVPTFTAEPAKVKTEPLSNYQFGHYQQPSVPTFTAEPAKVKTEPPPRQQMTWNEFQHSVGGKGYTKKEISAMYWEYKASFYK